MMTVRMGRRKAALTVTVLMALASAGCVTDSGSPVRGAATALGFATTVPEPRDFVVASRAAAPTEFVPVGRTGAPRSIPIRNVEGARALEADLDRTRAGSQAFARRALPAGAYGQPLPSVAAPARAAGPQPESVPVNPERARRMRENAERFRR